MFLSTLCFEKAKLFLNFLFLFVLYQRVALLTKLPQFACARFKTFTLLMSTSLAAFNRMFEVHLKNVSQDVPKTSNEQSRISPNK